ncbi:hypothetical protein CFK38_03180 [Brachybacterium vulturis]|uniref:DUF1905 domain-containing protein n=1 Tax=Brachybacterium vulturis TaxID=2017484 RepID=A0A291GSB5_9MICO|nr:DUF1905 domain-containing protein [Brachybacterium vulturis]ATG53087.1 hypothetical protein CFK38_03180 [Brachybacterium vulturis]
MDLSFSATTVEWRGPAPFVFAPVPEEEADAIAAIAPAATYGWGCIPAAVRIGDTDFTTSLFPRDGGYLVPVKVAVQRAEQIGVGDRVAVSLHIEAR